MSALENWLLAHPDILQFQPDMRPLVSGAGVVLCLLWCVVARDKHIVPDKTLPVPKWALRCFRFCWAAGLPAMLLDFDGTDDHPLWMKIAAAASFLVWLAMFGVGIGGIVRAAFRQARYLKQS